MYIFCINIKRFWYESNTEIKKNSYSVKYKIRAHVFCQSCPPSSKLWNSHLYFVFLRYLTVNDLTLFSTQYFDFWSTISWLIFQIIYNNSLGGWDQVVQRGELLCPNQYTHPWAETWVRLVGINHHLPAYNIGMVGEPAW